jgi:hypothetical protein
MSTTVVIGASSTVQFMGSYCFISASWGADPGRQDAFCLGSWSPSEEHLVYKPQQTLSLTLYAPGPTYDTTPSEGCDTDGAVSASVDAQTCDGGDGVSGDNWQVNSYSYSKSSKDQPAQESWSLIRYIGASEILTGAAASRAVEPSFVVRGITIGQSTDPANTGIAFSDTFASSKSGNVSAGATGTASTTTHGVVSSVGGGSSAVNVVGEGSASIPLTPMYI